MLGYKIVDTSGRSRQDSPSGSTSGQIRVGRRWGQNPRCGDQSTQVLYPRLDISTIMILLATDTHGQTQIRYKNKSATGTHKQILTKLKMMSYYESGPKKASKATIIR
jgi:hypothetical protein